MPSGSGKLVKVAWASQQAEAELIQGLLREHGIPSMAKRDTWDVPEMLAAGPRQILVAEEYAERARQVIEGAEGETLPGD